MSLSSKMILRSFLLLFLIFSRLVAEENIDYEEIKTNTIQVLSITQGAVAGVLFILPWTDNTLCETTSNLTSLLGVTCGVADLVSAVHFPRSQDRNQSLNPYLVFGFLELMASICCIRNDTFGWLGAVFLVYCGAERYCMAQILAKRRYVAPL